MAGRLRFGLRGGAGTLPIPSSRTPSGIGGLNSGNSIQNATLTRRPEEQKSLNPLLQAGLGIGQSILGAGAQKLGGSLVGSLFGGGTATAAGSGAAVATPQIIGATATQGGAAAGSGAAASGASALGPLAIAAAVVGGSFAINKGGKRTKLNKARNTFREFLKENTNLGKDQGFINASGNQANVLTHRGENTALFTRAKQLTRETAIAVARLQVQNSENITGNARKSKVRTRTGGGKHAKAAQNFGKTAQEGNTILARAITQDAETEEDLLQNLDALIKTMELSKTRTRIELGSSFAPREKGLRVELTTPIEQSRRRGSQGKAFGEVPDLFLLGQKDASSPRSNKELVQRLKTRDLGFITPDIFNELREIAGAQGVDFSLSDDFSDPTQSNIQQFQNVAFRSLVESATRGAKTTEAFEANMERIRFNAQTAALENGV